MHYSVYCLTVFCLPHGNNTSSRENEVDHQPHGLNLNPSNFGMLLMEEC